MEAKAWLQDWRTDALKAIQQLTELRQRPNVPGHELTRCVINVHDSIAKFLAACDVLEFTLPEEDKDQLDTLRTAAEIFKSANPVHDCRQNNVELLRYQIESTLHF